MNRLRWWALAGAATLLVGCDLGAPLRVVDEPREVLAVEVSPASQEVAVGGNATFTVRVLGRGDRELTEFTPSWGVGDPTVAVVTAPGAIQALQRGETEVIVRAGGRVGLARMLVR